MNILLSGYTEPFHKERDKTKKAMQRQAGAHRLKTELVMHGYDTICIDFMTEFTVDELVRIIDNVVLPGEFVGFSTTFIQRCFPDAFALFKKDALTDVYPLYFSHEECAVLFDAIKRKGAKVIVGGAYVDKVWFQHPVYKQVDAFFKGQADASLIEFVKGNLKPNILSGRKEYAQIDWDNFSTSRIMYTENDAVIPREPLALDLSRGCMFNCKFCSSRATRKKNEFLKQYETLRDELIANYQTTGCVDYYVTDELINDSVEKMELMMRVKKELPWFSYGGYFRLDVIHGHPEMADMLTKSGCKSVFFGIETFDKRAGSVMGKGMGEERIKPALKLVRERNPDLHVLCSLIAGLPYDTEESIVHTLEYMQNTDDVDHAPLTTLMVNDQIRPMFEKWFNFERASPLSDILLWSDKTGELPIKDFHHAVEVSNRRFEYDKAVTSVHFASISLLRAIGYDVNRKNLTKLVRETDFDSDYQEKVIQPYKQKLLEKFG